ncbi:aldo/keto reductase [Microvirga subterranea]|nr:aldo/keto reductase [Microvirga subterranea]
METLAAPGPKLGLGLLSIGRSWGVAQRPPATEDEAQALLDIAVELGITIFDTAPAYAESEARLGRFLAGLSRSRRSSLAVMTKAGEHWDAERQAGFADHSRDALVRSTDRSLNLLGKIDVLQIHKATREVVTHPDVLAAIDHARACGVTAFGASVSDLEAGRAALESGIYRFLQFPLNRSNTAMLPLLPEIEARNVTPVINRPFAMGALLAQGSSEEAARSAFRFIEEQAPNVIVLTGTGRVAHLVENVEAFRSRHG